MCFSLIYQFRISGAPRNWRCGAKLRWITLLYIFINLTKIRKKTKENHDPYRVYLTNRFHFPVVCSVIDAQMTSQRSKNKTMAHETKLSGSLMFLPRCDVLCASTTEQTTGKWNLFVLYNKYTKNTFQKIYWILLGKFRGVKKDDVSADVIHDLYKSSNVIGSWYCSEIRDWFT